MDKDENVEMAELRKMMPSDALKVIDTLPEEKRATIMAAFTQVTAFSGPLPHPDHLAEYEKVLPGLADRIVSMAEQNADHRRQTDKTFMRRLLNQRLLGQIIGGVLCIGCLFAAYKLGMAGHDWLAFGLGVTSFIGAGTIFVLGKIPNKQEQSNKKKES